ncbi:Conserved hypothetical protein [Prochlorococcus marinus str. MIT 9313]|uniref:Uncharacterized protein n=1 Tax=Prochlorococcus marinus (strain MIT 9313) TaxID=74547 RepID=B9ERM8_PROMM|nr:Conserved hypothetical protein [Prochlorococcus marinus str. MIT 9313]
MTKKLDEIPPEQSRSFDRLVNFTDVAVDHLLGIDSLGFRLIYL